MLLLLAVGLNVSVLFWVKVTECLPLGISFYTFQVISYLVDVYRGKIRRETSLIRFATYIMMFPQLIMGPIVEYGEVRGELKRRKVNAKDIEQGGMLFVAGLFCKVVLSDKLGILWNDVWVTGYENISTPLAWITAISYSLKLYFDFYGYSLMAIGLGNLMGFHLPENFRLPYMAGSVSEFYRRWHMTLGRWFKQYIYIPLGGNRQGLFLTVCNLWIVWILTGFWHGCSWNFLLWGIFLWFFIALEKVLHKLFGQAKWPQKIKWLSHVYVWLVIPVSWIFFAISDLGQLQIFMHRMFALGQVVCENPGDYLMILRDYGVLLAMGLFGITPWAAKLYRKCCEKKWFMVCMALLFWWCVHLLVSEGENPFMYLVY